MHIARYLYNGSVPNEEQRNGRAATMTTTIDCPTCERLGRVTVILPNGTLSTTTCSDCSGEGVRYPCNDPACRYCNAARAGALPLTTLVDVPTGEGAMY